MVPVWAMMAAGSALGAMKSKQENEQARRNAEVESTIAKYSPWTGQQADPSRVRHANTMGNVMQGALAGAQFGQDYMKLKKDLEVPTVDVNKNPTGFNAVNTRGFSPAPMIPTQQSQWGDPTIINQLPMQAPKQMWS